MAVLSTPAWAEVRPFPGAERVLRAHGPALPQPDQLCGPFSAHLALAATGVGATVVDLARAAGTRIWPHDQASWRPAGAPLDRTGWDALPTTSEESAGGTDAAGLAPAIETVTLGAVRVVPASGVTPETLGALLAALASAAYDVGVLANVRTGAMVEQAGDPVTWDVGHFVVLVGVAGDHVAVADTYRELGAPDAPPGCRLVRTAAVARALAAPPGRGLLLLVRTHDGPAATELVRDAGLSVRLWSA